MDFHQAIERLGENVPFDEVAEALGVPVSYVFQYVRHPDVALEDFPPEQWHDALARVARRRGAEYRALAAELEQPEAGKGAGYAVVSTFVKYIVWEHFSELVKLRNIRAFKDLSELWLDRFPTLESGGTDVEPKVNNFYSLPGTASRRGDRFRIRFGEGELLRANEDHALVFGYAVEEKLKIIHPDPAEEGIVIHGPLGQEELRLEVHLPNTRTFLGTDTIRVLGTRAGEETLIPSEAYRLGISPFRNNEDMSVPGTPVLRLSMCPPPPVDSIRVMWGWSLSKSQQAAGVQAPRGRA